MRPTGEPATDKLLISTGVLQRIERLFLQKEANSIVNAKAKAAQQAVSILRDNVKQSVDINFHKFRAEPVETVVVCVLRCTKDVLQNISLLEYFNSSHATEIGMSISAKLEAYSNVEWGQHPHKAQKDPNELRRADHIFLELFYNLRSYWLVRSKGLLLSQTYDKEYQALVSQLNAINDACAAASGSRHFHKLLEVILHMGNFMNGPNKQALGFKLSFLQNISVTKDDSSTLTFLHFIESTIRTGLTPEISQFTEDLAPAVKVSDVSIESLKNMCNDFITQVDGMSQTLTKGLLSDPKSMHPKDRCVSVIKPAVEKAEPLARDLKQRLAVTEKNVKEVMELYGESYEDTDEVDQFFNRFSTFVCMYKQAKIDNIKRAEEKRIYDLRQEQYRERERKVKELEEMAAKHGRTNADTVIERLKNPESAVPRSRRRLEREQERRPSENGIGQSEKGSESETTDDGMSEDVVGQAQKLLEILNDP